MHLIFSDIILFTNAPAHGDVTQRLSFVVSEFVSSTLSHGPGI